MKNNNNRFNLLLSSLILISLLTTMVFCIASFAQEESTSAPLPGSINNVSIPQNNPVQNNSGASSVQGSSTQAISATVTDVSLEDFPVSISGLKTLIEKYKEESKSTALEKANLNPLLIWLDGLIKSHNKLAAAFAKQVNLKTNFDSECSLVRELRFIKDEVLYLKAQALIKEKAQRCHSNFN